LQVVCRQLWERLRPAVGGVITPDDVLKIGNVDDALADYYAEGVAAVARQSAVAERAIRDWFEQQLITEQGIRGQVLQGPDESQGLDNRAIDFLLNTYLVRKENRRGATWFELAHDRLMGPVKKSNAQWRQTHLSPLQVQAALWSRQGRPPDLLVRESVLADMEHWAEANPSALTPTDRDFLAACGKLRAQTRRERRNQMLIAALAVGSSVLALALVIALLKDLRHRAQLTQSEGALKAQQVVLEQRETELAKQKQDFADEQAKVARLNEEKAALENKLIGLLGNQQYTALAAQQTLGAKEKLSVAQRSKAATAADPGDIARTKWPDGTTLRASYLDGAPDLRDRVSRLAQQWTLYGNVRLDFLPPDPPPGAAPQIRVTFQGSGSWSFVGTDSQRIGPPEPTMCLNAASRATEPAAFSANVLREFGHALGMPNGLANPNTHIDWNKPALYEFYGRAYGWSTAQVDQFFLHKARGAPSEYPPFDPRSVMLIPIAKELTNDGFSVGWNSALSDGDKKFAARLYPFKDPPTELTPGGEPLKVEAERLRLDRYRFAVKTPGRYAVEVEGPTGAEITLFGPDEVSLLASVEESKEQKSQVAQALGAGTYYVKVRYFRLENGAQYTIRVVPAPG
jgi:hypothetical protein